MPIRMPATMPPARLRPEEAAVPRSVVSIVAVVALAITTLPSTLARAAATPEPWDQPFRATAQELLDAAARLPSEPGDSVVILLEDGRLTLEPDCALVRTYRLVYRVLDDAGVREWGSVSGSWEPWREERPGLRARVVTPDGVEHALDPTTIDEAAREAAKGATDTGLEFGEAAIVPVRPAQRRERGYGDCKDKATLMGAMLRALGHRADVALLTPGLFADIDADVPGLRQFTHAIVAAGDPPLFIDATIPEAAVGELPDADRNRLALIARSDTAAPVRTPPSSPETDRTVETVEMTLAEDGPGSLTELTEAWGAFAISHRSARRDATTQSLKESLTTWVRSAWLAESVDEIEASPADDLASPTRLRYRALQARRQSTD